MGLVIARQVQNNIIKRSKKLRDLGMSKRAGGGNATVTRVYAQATCIKLMAIQSFAYLHIHFLLPISGAAAYLTSCRRLLAEISTSLGPSKLAFSCYLVNFEMICSSRELEHDAFLRVVCDLQPRQRKHLLETNLM